VIDTSMFLPANELRSTFQSWKPAELPVAAFHAPVVPVGAHANAPAVPERVM
jgi:hypothetical protein